MSEETNPVLRFNDVLSRLGGGHYCEGNLWHAKRLEMRLRGSKGAREYLFGFLDILGFKNFLENGELVKLTYVFEDIADELYQHQRMAYLHAPLSIYPQISNFSDTIFLFSRYPCRKEFPVLSRRVWELFDGAVRSIVRGAFRQGVPLRGGIAVGELYEDSLNSLIPDSVSRFGGAIDIKLAEEYEQAFGKPLYPANEKDEFEGGLLPAQPFSFLFGHSLLSAFYAQECESACNNDPLRGKIGVQN